MKNRRVLFTSPVQRVGGCSANVYSWDKAPTRVRLFLSFLNHPGLCFLKANVPCEILEYPTQEAFSAALADPPDVLGISFYINQTEIVLRMVAEARRRGVREVWAGNFGAYTPWIASHFDRVIDGWGEAPVAAALGSAPAQELIHPEMYCAAGTNLFSGVGLAGMLFTSRGCPYTCNFCQTPEFYGQATPIPLAAIDRVLWAYSRRGVRAINVLDENFGTFPRHAREVADLLHRHGMRWIALTRVDTLTRHFDEWRARGLAGAHLGIESLNQSALAAAAKRIHQPDSVRLLERMSRHRMFVQAFYILGFPTDTAESIRGDIALLARLDIDVVQVQVLTPFPRTRQCQEIEQQFGITDFNLSQYNSRHLVWNHPHISPDEMRELQRWANTQLSSSWRAVRTVGKLALAFSGLQIGSRFGAAARLHQRFKTRLKAARQTCDDGWNADEEVGPDQSLTAAPETVQRESVACASG